MQYTKINKWRKQIIAADTNKQPKHKTNKRRNRIKPLNTRE